MFAEADLTAETPLAENAPLLLMAMADDAARMAGLMGDAVAEPHTPGNGAPATRLAGDGLTGAYGMTVIVR